MTEFLRRNRVLLTSCGLLFLSLLLVSVASRYPANRDPVGRILLDAFAPLQAGINWGRIGMERVWSSYFALVGTNRDNQTLRDRIAVLEQQLTRLGELERETQRLEHLLQFRASLGGQVFGARVIGRDPLSWTRTLTLDRGERDGIRKGMAVLAPQGVVGQVIDVSWMSARVLVLTDHNSGIDAIVQRSRARGIVQGALAEGCHMKYLRRGEDVVVGDVVVTSGLDRIFPKGIPIGQIVDVSRRQRALLQVATLQPSAPLEQVEEVLIVAPPVPSDEG